MLPTRLRHEVEAAAASHWHEPVELGAVQPLGGGCISNACRLSFSSARHAFLKWCARGQLPAGIFAAEGQALRALAATGAVRVPAIIAESSAGEFEWLLMEWLEPARLTSSAWSALGRALAELHQSRHARFGWHDANFIGSLPQSNEWSSDWPEFWRTQRLLPQFERASGSGGLRAQERRRLEAVCYGLEDIIAVGNAEGASLLHGDLWNGNVLGVADGAALIDPSIYYGHREVDLAMAALFGGFPDAFWQAYQEVWPLQPDGERRRLAYQLYYLLVHVNLFGGSYLASTLAAVRELGF